MARIFLLFLLPLFLASCTPKDSTLSDKPLFTGQEMIFETQLQTIALGSCNRQDLPQTIWPLIAQQQPDVWIWLGDNIYADTEDMEEMRAMYLKQKYDTAYTAFRSKIPVLGIWDDHDYGINDGGKDFGPKAASRDLMLDFLDVPADAAVRQREGGYQSYVFGPEDKQVKIILLDGRYFRDELQANPDKSTRYLRNETGDILGEAQWQWLQSELQDSKARVHLIACGIQMLAEEQVFEKWANFPTARKRLLDLLSTLQPSNTVLLSGDRHISELAAIQLPNWEHPLYELTASGMTHAYEGATAEPNQYRIGALVNQKNFALLQLDWSGEAPVITAVVKGLDNSDLLRYQLKTN